MIDGHTILRKVRVEIFLTGVENTDHLFLSDHAGDLREYVDSLNLITKFDFLDHTALTDLDAGDQVSLPGRQFPEVSDSNNFLAITETNRALRVRIAALDKTAAPHLIENETFSLGGEKAVQVAIEFPIGALIFKVRALAPAAITAAH